MSNPGYIHNIMCTVLANLLKSVLKTEAKSRGNLVTIVQRRVWDNQEYSTLAELITRKPDED